MKAETFGGVLEPADTPSLPQAPTAHGNDLGRVRPAGARSRRATRELLGLRWPDLRWPELRGDCGAMEVASRSGGKTTLARRTVALDPHHGHARRVARGVPCCGGQDRLRRPGLRVLCQSFGANRVVAVLGYAPGSGGSGTKGRFGQRHGASPIQHDPHARARLDQDAS